MEPVQSQPAQRVWRALTGKNHTQNQDGWFKNIVTGWLGGRFSHMYRTYEQALCLT